jgi:transcriptional regulator with XRE-family HTH domain
MADDLTAFGRRLRELREAADLTQHELAERSGLHRQAIVKLERGEREPAWSTLRALTRALNVSCAAFEQEAKPAAETPKADATPEKPKRTRKPKES